jgi:hypothetical protein
VLSQWAKMGWVPDLSMDGDGDLESAKFDAQVSWLTWAAVLPCEKQKTRCIC